MPFGLCNAPAKIQRMMNDIMRDYLHQLVTLASAGGAAAAAA
jgi:hypothetical protein